MTVPGVAFTDQGFVAPDERTEILPAVQADVDAAMGGGLNPALETPQGQLSSSFAAAVGATYDSFVRLVQMFDPAYTIGRFQDAIGRIYFIDRIGARATVVTATLLGAAGTVARAGTLAKAVDGNLYSSLLDVTIPISGTVDVGFACTTTGPISCPAGTLTIIYQAIPGLDAITNAADGLIGRLTETRDEFEKRRRLSTAKNSMGSLPSILGSILGVDGVLDAFVTENNENTIVSVGGATLGPHTIYCAVVGGLAADIAKAIWTKKGPGCGYNGNTTVTVYDTSPPYTPPYPAYAVLFEIPAPLPFIFNVVLANNPLVPADAATQAQNAIIDAFAGLDGGDRARIGATVYASRYLSAVAALGPWARVVSLQIGSANAALAVLLGQISTNVLTVTSVGSGVLAAGQTVQGAGVLPGTKIVSQLSGPTGGTGTYQINKSQTVGGPIQMTTCLANQNLIGVNINQVPVVSAGDITVSVS